MDYKKLKNEIKEISEIANSAPSQFKEKCFEILLNNLLATQKPIPKDIGGQNKDSETPLPSSGNLPITTQLRVFMTKTQTSEEEIKKILMYANGEVHFIREPKPNKIAQGQKYWALLLSLRNCILDNSLSVDPEDIRSICQEKGYYDQANFATLLKKPHFSKLFKGAMESQGEPQQLSNEGQDELAKLIKSLGTNV